MLMITVASDDEIEAVEDDVDLIGSPKDVLDDWRPVVVRVPPDDDPDGEPTMTVALYLLGTTRKRGKLVLTSQVTALDLDRGRATTVSGSLYLLGERVEAPMPLGMVHAITRQILDD